MTLITSDLGKDLSIIAAVFGLFVLLCGLFGFFFLGCGDAHASPILVDSSTTEEFVDREILTGCEWIDTFKVTTTTTYRELVLPTMGEHKEPELLVIHPSAFLGHINPCIVDLTDLDAVRNKPYWCQEGKIEVGAMGPMLASSSSNPSFRTWDETQVSYRTVPHNECEACGPHAVVPEASTGSMVWTGLGLILLGYPCRALYWRAVRRG